MVYYTGKPIEKLKASGPRAINKICYWSANNDFRRAKKQNKLFTVALLNIKSVGFHILLLRVTLATAIALEVIKYKAGKQFTFTTIPNRETTTVWISGVESLQENLTMCQPATKRIVLAFLIYFMSKLNSLMKEIVPKRDIWSRYGTKSAAVGCKQAANDDERCQSFG